MGNTLNFSEFDSVCRENRIYQAFNDDERWSLYKLAFKKHFREGSVVCYSSEKNNAEFYIVENGELELNLNSGKEKLYRRGDLFGEISVINGSARMGTMTALTDSELIAFDGKLLFSDKIMDSKISLSIFKGLVSYVVSYLDEEYVYATEHIIKKGEGVTVEFKESMSKVGKHDIIKTICAFMNTRGGTILLGINDASIVIGIKIGSLKEIDNYKQSIIQLWNTNCLCWK